MNQTIQELCERKSVRAFDGREIEPEKKKLVIEAALQAPTAGNMALYTIIDVTDQALKDKLAVTCDNQPFIAKAPMALIFCADYRRWYDVFCRYEEEVRKPGLGDMLLAYSDALIAAQNAVTAAWSMGIGSCYIGDILERFETHKELLDLPQYVVPAVMAVFGYPTQQQKERVKPARLKASDVVCENSYRNMEPERFANMLGERQGKSGKDLEAWIQAFCKRKWNSQFSCEMSRSVQVMAKNWME